MPTMGRAMANLLKVCVQAGPIMSQIVFPFVTFHISHTSHTEGVTKNNEVFTVGCLAGNRL